MPARRAASSSARWPVTLAAFDSSGASIERGTEPSAAWCSTKSTPETASPQMFAEATSPSTRRKRENLSRPSFAFTSSRLARRPVEKLSRPVTDWSSSSSDSSSEEPMKPATPVTSQRRGFALSCCWTSS
jgi:hypothetical protein